MSEARRFNSEQRSALYLAAGGCCELCGVPLDRGWHADHVVPWSEGGATDVANGQATCPECNLRKGTNTMDGDGRSFDHIFSDTGFAPPSDFGPRVWQAECLDAWLSRTSNQFLVSAGVGAGKTSMAALLAATALGSGVAARVIYVAPNTAILGDVQRTFKQFGIHTVLWSNRKHGALGEPAGVDGAITTYQSLGRAPGNQRRLCRKRTLVIFDEIHHLGDESDWGKDAKEAFEHAAEVIGLSGTPYRTDDRQIPFVEYQEIDPDRPSLRRFKAEPPNGYTYTLGRGVFEGVNRTPLFEWLAGTVQISPSNGPDRLVTFDDDLSIELANLRLAGAVRYGSVPRADALAYVVDICRRERRKLIIFLGGDSNSNVAACDDARVHLPAELEAIGVDPAHVVPVTGGDKDSVAKIEAFGNSDAWILPCVNLISEGVNIPPLSAALFLTSITAKQTTVQRIGRALRRMGDTDVHSDAKMFMFKDPRYVQYSTEIEDEIEHEFCVRGAVRESNGPGQAAPRRATAIGVGGFAADGITFNGRVFTQAQCQQALERLSRESLCRSHIGPYLCAMFPPEAA